MRRAYCHCPACGAGFFPRDHVGLAGGSLSPAVTRMIGRTAAVASFLESSALLGDLAGLRFDAKQVERTAEALGAEIARDERECHHRFALLSPERAPRRLLGTKTR